MPVKGKLHKLVENNSIRGSPNLDPNINININKDSNSSSRSNSS